MPASCLHCGVAVDPLRDPARIVGGRIANVCRSCAASGRASIAPPARNAPLAPIAPIAPPAPPTPPTPPTPTSRDRDPDRTPTSTRANEPVPAARARASARGLRIVVYVALVAAACAAAAAIGPRLSTSAEATAPRAPAASPGRALSLASTTAPFASTTSSTTAPTAAPPTAPVAVAPTERARPRAPKLPEGAFVHPLPGPELLVPKNGDRLFGAPRPGDRAPECGEGHCGVDLGEVVGTPVMAVRHARVYKIVRHSDRRGGRWVQLEHEGGMMTYYMHLDEIRSDLRIGSVVAAGEPIGTLGRSGIKNSAPHLHFAVTMHDGGDETYVDPLPLLREATLITEPPAFPDDVTEAEADTRAP